MTLLEALAKPRIHIAIMLHCVGENAHIAGLPRFRYLGGIERTRP
jgi:hypothetical protein